MVFAVIKPEKRNIVDLLVYNYSGPGFFPFNQKPTAVFHKD